MDKGQLTGFEEGLQELLANILTGLCGQPGN